MESPSALLPVEEARARVLALVQPLPSEDAPIEDALGRALARDVMAVRTLPPWDNSAMDGYAVRAEDVANPPVELEVVETLYAGQQPRRALGPGECARIMTGAPVPVGADAVVMQERTRRRSERRVEVLAPVRPGANVRARGEDASAGSLLLPAAAALGIPEASLLWAQGLTSAPVPRRPRVALFSTGDELVPVGTQDEGRLVDTNSPAIAAAVRRAGGVPTLLGIARDALEDIRGLVRLASEYDVVLSTAGVSVGDKDHVRAALEAEGVTLSFWRVAMKPGKPLAVGSRGRTLFVGLPGNPTSALVTFELFVRPALLRLLGHGAVEPRPIPGVCAASYRKEPGLTHFVRVAARWAGGRWLAQPLPTQTSNALRSASAATHLMVVPADSSGLEPGAEVELLPLSWVAV